MPSHRLSRSRDGVLARVQRTRLSAARRRRELREQNPTDLLERRVLTHFHENPWSTWFACEKALGITTDVAALVAAFDVRERLNRDRAFEIFHPDGMPSIYRLTDTGLERLMAVTESGEAPLAGAV